MQKKTSLLFGMTLILLGILALAGNLLIRAAGSGFLLGFHAWPIFVVGAGLLFCLPPFIFSKVHGLSGLFIPGIPTLTTGILLFIASITGSWHIWSYLWPLEVISVALGFILMAIFLKVPWLMIPASIIGLTGLVLAILRGDRIVEFLGCTVDGGAVRSGSAASAHWHVQEDRGRKNGRHHPVRFCWSGLCRHVHRPGYFAVDHAFDRSGNCTGVRYFDGCLSFAETLV